MTFRSFELGENKPLNSPRQAINRFAITTAADKKNPAE
jgi:hypothetical protein